MDARLPSGAVGGPRAPASFYCPISMVRPTACTTVRAFGMLRMQFVCCLARPDPPPNEWPSCLQLGHSFGPQACCA